MSGRLLLLGTAVASGDRSALSSVTTFVKQQLAALRTLRGGPAEHAVAASMDLLDAVANRLTEINAAIAKGCSFPTVDRYGPVPVSTC